jgi:hypothetical protein
MYVNIPPTLGSSSATAGTATAAPSISVKATDFLDPHDDFVIPAKAGIHV